MNIMLPSELKLTHLKHCYVQLPEAALLKLSTLKAESIVSIRSVDRSDTELCVLWNGRFSSGKHVELDFTFGRCNGFEDERVILSLVNNIGPPKECSLCSVELLDASDYNILSQHSDVNLLNTCKLVSKGLVVPIYLSQNVKVLVKILDLQPGKDFGLLTKWTDLQFLTPSDNVPTKNCEQAEDKDIPIDQPIPLISFSLGLGYRPKFNLGSMLVCGERGSGKTHFLKTTIYNYRRFNSELINCKQFRGKRPENVKKRFQELLSSALEKQPFILGLDDIDSVVSSDPKHEDDKGQDAIYKKRLVDAFCNLLKQLERSETGNDGGSQNIIVIATCRSFEALDHKISKSKGRHYFSKILKIGHPNLQERMTVIKGLIAEHKQIESSLDGDQLEIVAKRCGSCMPLDLRRIVERSIINACSKSLMEFNSDPITIQVDDLLSSLDDYVPSNLRGIALKPKSSRTFDNVGGMRKIKESLMKAVVLQVKYLKLFKKFPMKSQNSVLLYGPPGCGKTLVAEALTNQDCINSICVKGPELLSKYIGASEAAVRNLFKRAELAKPCVIFFDEFESLVAKRGTDSTGVTDRVVNQFLTLMDGVEKLSDDIFIIAATSRPDMIDPAILRPGRLDQHIYCPCPDHEDRLDILKVLSKDIIIENFESNLAIWARKLDCFTGADIQSFLCSAQLKALHEIVGASDEFEGGKYRKNDKFINRKDELASLEIKIKQVHLEESYDEMKDEVVKRYPNLLKQYPNSIRKKLGKQIAARTTLA